MENKTLKQTPLAEFEIGTYFMNTEKQQLLRIVDKEFLKVIKKTSKSKVKEPTREIFDWIYTVEFLGLKQSSTFGRYYEGRLSNECVKVSDQLLTRAIFES